MEADLFVFLDDAQFSKGSYTNRVGICAQVGQRWLTVPVKVHLGQTINDINAANAGWKNNHLEILRQTYKASPCFSDAWPGIEKSLASLESENLADINIRLLEFAIERLGIQIKTCRASSLDASGQSDDRLIAILGEVAPGCVYLSGEGGGKYQSDQKFQARGFDIRYLDFIHPVYSQTTTDNSFVSGLSVLDAVFNLGWEETGRLLNSSGR